MSRGLTHGLGVLVAVLSGSGGFVFLAIGSVRVLQAYMRLDLGSGAAAAGFGLQCAGIALLVVAALTALWTPAGLLCLGALSLASLVVSALPLAFSGALLDVPFLGVASFTLITSGVPQVLGAILGATGLAVLLRTLHQRSRRTLPSPHRRQRRQPRTIAGHIIGLVAALVLFPLGLLLLLRGLAETLMAAQIQLVSGTQPLWLLAIPAGFVLILAACVTVRWSPFALLLPAFLLLILTGVSFLPQLGYAYLLDVAARNVGTFLVLGGFTTVVLLLACSVVAIVHWARDRRIAQHTAPGPGSGPGPGYPPTAAGGPLVGPPPAPGAPAAGGAPPAGGAPAAGGAPPAPGTWR